MRQGADYFLQPARATQRRYEALRAYFVEELPASQVADQFGYSTASVHQMATLLRSGKLQLFADSKPGPKGPRKATGQLREQVLALRAGDHSVTEIAQALTTNGLPVSAQTVWQILQDHGLPRLPRRDEGRRGSPARLDPVKAAPLAAWPSSARLPCDHAGLLLLVPAMADLGLHDLVNQAGYPSTSQLDAWQSIGTLLLAKCARRPRVHHIGSLTDDVGLAFTLGLAALPKATHLGTYSYRVRRQSNHHLLTGLVRALQPLGLATGAAGFNLDFHAIRHHGDDAILDKHYVPRRSQRTRAVLTFFAQDHTRDGLRQRRHHHHRAGPRDPRVCRLLAGGHRHRPRPAGLRLPAHHLHRARGAERPRHPLAHASPARQGRAGPAGRPARLRMDDRPHPAVRPLPQPPPAR